MRIACLLLYFISWIQLAAQCPDIAQTNVSPSCKPSCELCSGDKFTITLVGEDLPHNGKVDYYADVNPGFNPYSGQGIKIGSSNISTPNPKCRICPILLGFMIDACGLEAKNEFMVIWTGSGFNTADFNFDYASTNNTGGAPNADIGPGGCGITNGNPGLVGGCSAIPVGNNFDLPPNAIWIVFTSVTAFTNYDFSSVCGLTCKIYVSSSTCDRVIGAFSNFDANVGPRTQVMTITGCGCSTNAIYDVPGSLTGQGDFWAEGSIVNNGCATPSFNAPNYTAAKSTVDPFMYSIPQSWCDKSFEIVGILNPKPDANCCMEEFTDRFTVNVKCPKATSATLELCEINNGQSIFTLEDANIEILSGSNGTVLFYKDQAASQKINSPYTSGNTTIYAKVVDGNCSSLLVPVILKVLLLPIAKSTSAELCDDGSGFATFDLKQLETIIKNGNNAATVMFFKDMNKSIPINSPFTTGTTTIYATIFNSKCESNPVAITLTVLNKPIANDTTITSCPENDGKATFILNSLIPGITNNQLGVTVKFYEDSMQIKELFSPYRSNTDTIYAFVSNAKCKSNPVPIILKVVSLNLIPSISAKNCDDGNGSATFDLVNVEKILKQGDTTLKVKWYHDSLQMIQLLPPVFITGMDTIYAFLFKDSCQSTYISILLEAIKRPTANSYLWNFCSVTGDSMYFDLDLIKDSINQKNGLPVLFSKDSLFATLVSGSYFAKNDTLFAVSLDGNCTSTPVKLILHVQQTPSFIKTADIIVCDYFVLPTIAGLNLTPNASYHQSTGNKGIKWNAGDTIKQGRMIYLYDSLASCIVQDSFFLDIIRKPQAGLDQSISVCEGKLVNLNQYLINADSGGSFLDIDNSGSLKDSIFNSKGHNGATLRFGYILNANAYCPNDTSFITIKIVKQLSAGKDYLDTICETVVLNINPTLRGADGGGQLIDSLNTGGLLANAWDSNISGPGTFVVKYLIGDDITCPKDQAYTTIVVKPSIEIDNIGSQIGCDYYILPPITGKNANGKTSYYSLPNGSGTKYFAGDTIKTIQRIYIYGEEKGYCSDEENFFIIISPPIFGKKLSIPLCVGDSVLIGKTYYGLNNPNGIEKFNTKAANGCDSLYQVVVLFKIKTEGFINQTLCENESIIVNNRKYDYTYPKGTEILKAANQYGCDSTIYVDLKFIPNSKSTYTDKLCKGGQIILNGKIYDENNLNGVDTLKNASSKGCDSIVVINIQLLTPTLFTFRKQICNNDTVVLGNIVFYKNNLNLNDTLEGQATNGCDSIRDIQVQLYQDAISNYSQILCDNQSVVINGTRYDKNKPSGQEILKAVSINGCDSTLNISLTFKASISQNYSATICENDSLWIHGKRYDKKRLTGIDTLAGQASGGCDSIVIVQLRLLLNKMLQISDTLCPDEHIIINGNIYNLQNKSGTERLSSSTGCDSILNIDLHFLTLNLQYTGEIFIVPGQSQTLQIIPSFTPSQINWSPSIGLSCKDCLNPVTNPTETTTYTITLTDEHGCIVTAQITIRVEIDDRVFIPNAFSPNGDNINDLFRVVSENSNLLISDFAIYDRWGNLVYFESDKTISNLRGWDGNTTGKEKINPGVYAYYIRLKIPGAADKIFYGDVSLIR